jgi:pimeloyl-ACP methyl ester carboxylesterase
MTSFLLPRRRPVRCALLIALFAAVATPTDIASAPVTPTAACVDRVGAGQRPSTIPARLPELRYTCMALANGKHIWVGEAGETHEKAVLLVHGLGNLAHRDWRHAVAALAKQFRVIALDLPGFGASEALPQGYSFAALSATLDEVLDRSGVTRAHVVGHSLGGALSLAFAHRYPRRVDRLVLVDAAGILHKTVFVRHIAKIDFPPLGIPTIDRLFDSLGRQIRGWSRAILQRLEDNFDFSRWLHDNPRVRDALIGEYTQVDAALGLVEHDFTRAIRELSGPTILVWGRDDPIAPLRIGVLLAGRLPNARLHVMDGIAHVPMNEDPPRFLAILLPALSAPLTANFVPTVPDTRNGNVACRDRSNASFTGYFDSLTLTNCANAKIENARIRRLTLTSSTATLTHASIDSADTALTAKNSRVTATAVEIRGRVAIRADNSELDLAGARLRADERGIDANAGSRLYFSVSELATPEFTGDAHFVWSDKVQPPNKPATPDTNR